MRAELYEREGGGRPLWAVQWLADRDSWREIGKLGAVFICPQELLQLRGEEEATLALADGTMVEVPVGWWVVKAGPTDYFPVDPLYFEDHFRRKFVEAPDPA